MPTPDRQGADRTREAALAALADLCSCRRCKCLDCEREGAGELHDHVCTQGQRCIEAPARWKAWERRVFAACRQAEAALRAHPAETADGGALGRDPADEADYDHDAEIQEIADGAWGGVLLPGRAAEKLARKGKWPPRVSDEQPQAENAQRLSPKGASAIGEAETPNRPDPNPRSDSETAAFEIRERCATCRYWMEDEKAQAPEGVRYCDYVKQIWNVTEWSEDEDEHRRVLKPEYRHLKAFVEDGSDYRAELLTHAEFGCTAWSALPATPTKGEAPC